jgi:tetratricopeptide (TPR) repeat protein
VVVTSGYLIYLKTAGGEPQTVLGRDRENWENAVEQDPGNALAHANLAASYQDLGDIDGAIGEFEKALSIAPEEYTFMFRLGIAYRSAGRLDDAINMLNQAADLFPEGEKYASYYQVAEINFERGDSSLAKDYVQKSIDDNDLIWNSHLLMGKLLTAEGNIDQAREELQKAAQFNPEDPELQEALKQVSG